MKKHSEADITALLKKLTLEEKASLLSGKDFWRTKNIDRLGIPSIMVSDGPHGLRRQTEEGANFNDSIQAVCFPAACATASSFDRNVLHQLGSVLADECHNKNVSTILGPAVNIKRSPLCGRNFEYMSEDPYLAGQLAASYIKGVQEKGIGTSLKHFALNNQEYRRLTNSSDADERTIREIYLPAFETAVKEAQPYTIMHSYNKINGTYSGESKWLLTDILRKEWGYTGLVMSDWGAVSNRTAGLEAGCDLEMPSSNGVNTQQIIKAVKDGKLSKKTLDLSCKRILKWIFNYIDNQQEGEFDFAKHHRIAKEIEKESVVLLKNNGMLPLKLSKPSGVMAGLKGKKYSLCLIGEFAEKPRYQGGGSSHINAVNVKGSLEVFKEKRIDFVYAKGYDTSLTDKIEDVNERENLIRKAVKLAKQSKNVIIFAGLPDSFESEGYDRSHMDMPDDQNELIRQVARANPKTTVVLHNGSPVSMPWVNDVNAIVEAYLGGEAVGEAVTDILLGSSNPCGKLAETFPLRLEDNPSYLNFANDKDHTNYAEGIFVGYRWYDSRNMDVLFPFGHGLSYTTFEYSNLSITPTNLKNDNTISISLSVKNTGKYDGKEVVQLYVCDKTKAAVRPLKELRGFEKVFIKAGARVKVTFTLNKRDLSWYNPELHCWYAAGGQYEILVGSSSRDIRARKTITYESTIQLPLEITDDTALGDLLRDPRTKEITLAALSKGKSVFETENTTVKEAISDEMTIQMEDGNPIRNIRTWNNISQKDYLKLIKDLKEALCSKSSETSDKKTKVSERKTKSASRQKRKIVKEK